MRMLILALVASLLSSGPAVAADDPIEPFDLGAIDAYFDAPSPDFGELLGDSVPSAEQCQLLASATEPIPFEATPAEIAARAEAYRTLGAALPGLEPATSAASTALDAAAAQGGDRQAMLGIWLDRAGLDALRELTVVATNHCGAELVWPAFGLADRIVELAGHDHPASEHIDDIASWAFSLTGEPLTLYWSFGYLGDEPLAVCEELNATLVSVGFSGTTVTIFRADAEDLPELASATVGEGCRPA